MAAQIRVNGVATTNVTVPLGVAVSIDNGNTGVTASQGLTVAAYPERYSETDPTAAPTQPAFATNFSAWTAEIDGTLTKAQAGPAFPAVLFTPDIPGRYLVILQSTNNDATISVQSAEIEVTGPESDQAAPSAGEETQAGGFRGWARNMNRLIEMERVRRGWERVYNGSGATLAANKVVKITGSPDWRTLAGNVVPGGAATARKRIMQVVLEDGTADGAGRNKHGIVAASIANGAFGWIKCDSAIHEGDFSAYIAGQRVYVDATGSLSATATNVSVGYVTVVNATGAMLVRDISNGTIAIEEMQVAFAEAHNSIVGSENLTFGTITDNRAIPMTTTGLHLGYNHTLAVGSGVGGDNPDLVTPSIHHKNFHDGDTDRGTGIDFRAGSGIIDIYCHGSMMMTMQYQGTGPAMNQIILQDYTLIKGHVTNALSVAVPALMNYSNATVGIGFDALDNTSDMGLTHSGIAMLRVRAANLQIGLGGDATDPGIAFRQYTTTGMGAESGKLNLYQGGVAALQLMSAFGVYSGSLPFIVNQTGGAAAPAYQYYSFGGGGYTCGVAFPSEGANLNGLSFNTMGVDRGRFTNDGHFVVNTGGAVGVTTGGSQTAVAYRVANTPGTGVYGSATTVAVSVAGSQRATFYTNGVEFSYPLFLANGTAGAPALAFGGDALQDSGAYLFGPNAIAMSTAGVQRTLWDAAGNFVVGTAALATSATDGFLYITSTPGTPTGIATPYAGRSSIVADSTNGLLYFDNGGTWVKVGVSGSGSNTQVAYWNGSSTLAGSANFIWNGSALAVTGDITATADIAASSRLLAGNGSAISPSHGFNSTTGLGMYRVGADTVGFATAAVLRMAIYTNAIETTIPIGTPDGTAGAPSWYLVNSPTTGLWRNGANAIGVSTAGVNRMTVYTNAIEASLPIYAINGTASATGYAFSNSTGAGMYLVTTDYLGFSAAGVIRTYVTASDSGSLVLFKAEAGLRVSDGNAAAPSMALINGTGTGLYKYATDTLGVATAGVARLSIASTLTSFVQFLGITGSAAAPTYAFDSFGSTGVWRNGANAIGFSTNGTNRMTIYTNAVESSLPIYAPNGIVSAPSYTFSNSIGTGVYLVADNYIGITTGGGIRFYATNSVTGATLLFQAEGGIRVPVGSLGTMSIRNLTVANTGIYFPSTDSIGFGTNGADVARFSPNANLLLGTTTDGSTRLHVKDATHDRFVTTTEGIAISASGATSHFAKSRYMNGSSESFQFLWGERYFTGEVPYYENVVELNFGSGFGTFDVNGAMTVNSLSSPGTIAGLTVDGQDILVRSGDKANGVGVIAIKNASTNPSTNPSGGGILYTDSGALKYRGSAGTVTTIAVA